MLQDEVHFIHGHKNSLEIEQAKKIEPPEFFDTFEKQVTGILIATSSLINEGLDLPSIDSVYITYQTKSISHLLQTAGRALRYSEGKQSATIIQVKANDLSYFFNSAWLYQDISDRLRPQIEIIEYSNKEELIEQVLSFVNKKYVKLDELNILKQDLNNLSIGQNARLILFGIKFFGGTKEFKEKAQWRPLFINENDHSFINCFNEISFKEKINDTKSYGLELITKTNCFRN